MVKKRFAALCIVAACISGCAITHETLEAEGLPYTAFIPGEPGPIFDRITSQARRCVAKTTNTIEFDRLADNQVLLFTVGTKVTLEPMMLITGKLESGSGGVNLQARYFVPKLFNQDIHMRFLEAMKHWGNNQPHPCPYE
jgi:hypothetical protein